MQITRRKKDDEEEEEEGRTKVMCSWKGGSPANYMDKQVSKQTNTLMNIRSSRRTDPNQTRHLETNVYTRMKNKQTTKKKQSEKGRG